MSKNRLEAFSDAVIAILITIMVLELGVPAGDELRDLRPVAPTLVAYTLSFVVLGIYWNNHHHLLQASERVSGVVLWANLHLLFWLSLVPFTTEWMGHSEFSSWPVAMYGVVLWCAGVAYYGLTRSLVALHGRTSRLATALGRDNKGLLSIVIYTGAIAAAFIQPWVAFGTYVAVVILWLIPDRRLEHLLDRSAER